MKKNLTFIFTVAITAALFMLAACNGGNNNPQDPSNGGNDTTDTVKPEPEPEPNDPYANVEPAQWKGLHKDIRKTWPEVTMVIPLPSCGIEKFGFTQHNPAGSTWKSGNIAVTWQAPGDLEGYGKELEAAGWKYQLNDGNDWYINKDFYININDEGNIFYIYRAKDRE